MRSTPAAFRQAYVAEVAPPLLKPRRSPLLPPVCRTAVRACGSSETAAASRRRASPRTQHEALKKAATTHVSTSTAPVVITCALAGGIHGKEANERLPEQPDEIVEQGVAAVEAGAAILHVHARNADGSNTMDPTI